MAYPTPDDVAVGNCGATKTNSPRATWHGATPVGNKLYAFLQLVPTGTNVPTVSAKPSADWSLEAGPVGGDGGANGDPICICYSVENAASHSGLEAFTVSANCAWTMYLVSMPGMASVAADQQAVSNLTTAASSGTTGITPATTQADEIILGVIAVKNQIRALTAESEINGLSVTVQSEDATAVATASQGLVSQLLTARQTSIAARGFTNTITSSSPYGGLVVTGKAAGAAAYTDNATVALALIPSGADTSQKIEANTAILGLTPSTTVDNAAYVEANTALVSIIPSSIESYGRADSANLLLNLSPSDVDSAEYVEIATVSINLSPSGSDIDDLIESNLISIHLTPISLDVPVYVEAFTAVLNLLASSIDTTAFVDSAVTLLTLTPSGVEFLQTGLFDASTLVMGLIPSNLDIRDAIESATVNIVFTPSGVDIGQRSDTDTGIITLIPDEIDVPIYSDSAQGLLTLTPVGFDQVAGQGEEATLILRLIPGTLEVKLVAILTFTAFKRWVILEPSNRYGFKGFNRWRKL